MLWLLDISEPVPPVRPLTGRAAEALALSIDLGKFTFDLGEDLDSDGCGEGIPWDRSDDLASEFGGQRLGELVICL